MTAPRSGSSALGIVLVLALLAVGIVGASLGVGALTAERRTVEPAQLLRAEPGDVLAWSTDVVEFRASSFEITAAGRTFGVPRAPTVRSDPGDRERWTLEVAWQDPGIEQRVYVYFAADESSWWISEIRVYDGAPVGQADWVRWDPALARVPLGQPFEGDIDLTGPSPTGPVTLRIGGARIAVRPQDYQMTEPVGGVRIRVRENQDLLAVGSPLRCSGILQLTPQAAEARLLSLGYAVSWRWQTRTGSNTGFSDIMERAPASGWINDASAGAHGEIIVFVSNPGAPFGDPIPLPADCASP